MANFITIFRIFLVFIAAYLLFDKSFAGCMWALLLTIIAFSLDGVDGWVARKLNETSKLGAVLDIMSDRIVENTYWIVFAVLGWLPVVFPLFAITRSFVVDSLRSVAMEQGFTAFGETSMQSDKIGYMICCSKFSRVAYAVAKVLAFILIIFAKIPGLDHDISVFLFAIAYMLAIVALMFCLVRGLPVIFESKRLFKNEKV
ncbi:MAG: CDP-alcohol phosphatidyltransferase family protein [Candidatus Gastranaerophilales bacterium]|nr:CDP-alcohol phosphatidyltransferase family protein [Candidatus Gastranaerophilales bacterium]